MKNILVTGTNGLLGTNTVHALIAAGYNVVAMLRNINSYKGARSDSLVFVEGDITSMTDVINAASGCDAIIHCAAYTAQCGKEEAYYRVNTEGSINVFEAAARLKIRRVVNIANAYNNNKEFDKCLDICDTIIQKATSTNDSTLYAYCLQTKISSLTYKKLPEPQKAIQLFSYLTDSLHHIPGFALWNDIALNYLCVGNESTANEILRNLKLMVPNEPVYTAKLDFIQSKIDKMNQDFESSLANYQKTVIVQDSLFFLLLNRSAINVQKDYFKRQAEYDAERLKNNRIIIALIILSSLIATISLSYFCYRKVKDKEREKEMETARLSGRVREVLSELDKMKKANDEELSSMKNAIRSENKEMLSEFRDKINNLYRAKFMFLDNLCKQFYSYGMSAAKQKQIYKTVEENIKSFSDDEELYALEEIVNSFKDDVMKKLREDFPRFKDEDFKLMCYWYAGFSPAAMCVLMKIDEISDIYKRKSRLKSRIDKSDSPHKDCLLQNLHI